MAWTLGLGATRFSATAGEEIECVKFHRPAPRLPDDVADLSRLWPTFGRVLHSRFGREPGRVTSRRLEGQPADYSKGRSTTASITKAGAGRPASSKLSTGAIRVATATNAWWFPGADPSDYRPEEGRGMIVGHMPCLGPAGEWHGNEHALFHPPAEPSRAVRRTQQLAFDLQRREHICIEGLAVEAASMRWRIRPGASWIAAGYRTSRTSPFSTASDRSPRARHRSSRARRESSSAATTTSSSTPASVSAPGPGFICAAIIIRSTIA